MKKNILLLWTCSVLMLSGCIPYQTHEAATSPSGYANQYYFTKAEKTCYIKPDSGVAIYKVDGIDPGIRKSGRPMVIEARNQQLIVEGFRTAGNMRWKTGPKSLVYNFEEGKIYTIGHDFDTKSFYIQPITDKKELEIGQSFLEKQKAFRQETKH